MNCDKSKDSWILEKDIITLETDEEYEIEFFFEMRHKKESVVEYLVRWKNYGPEDDKWVKEHDMHCDEMLEEFIDTLKSLDEKRLCVIGVSASI